MNELTTKTIEPMIFETRTEHRGRTLDEQQSRHQQATGHNNPGKLQVREEKFAFPSGTTNRAIYVFQECLDCKEDTTELKIFDEASAPTREHLETLDKKQLLIRTGMRGLAGNKQTSKTKLIDTIINSY